MDYSPRCVSPRPIAWLRALLLLLPLTLMMLAGTALWAQKDTGAITGVVRDSSNAVVSGAKVIITDVDRDTSFVTTTNDQGTFVASPLKIGRYNVTVEKAGFKKALVGPVVLDAQERPEVHVALQVGAAAETVRVTSEGPQLETETSDLGQVVNSQRISTLPLNGRNYAQLAQLTAGVAPAEPGSRVAGSFGFAANGARTYQNNFLLDGIDNNSNLTDVLNETNYVIQPSVDAIAEFKVETNSYSAEFGRGNGGIMNAMIKSGTNEVHGDLYEFVRNEKLDARNAFDQFGRQPYKQNQFGFTLGGPIVKKRTFFFGDYEGLRVRQALPQLLLLPTPAQIAGDFSDSLDPTLTPLTDPGSTNPGHQILDCNGNSTFAGELFNTRQTLSGATNAFAAGNTTGFCGFPIGTDASGRPTNKFTSNAGLNTPIDPLAARLAALLPGPNVNISGNNFLVDPKRRVSRNNFDVRVDHKFTGSDDFFVRFSYEDQPSFIPGPFTNTVLDGGGFFSGNEDNSYRSVAISETHVFAPSLVNEFRVGYNRINSHRFQLNFDKNISGDPAFGINFPGVPFAAGTNNGGLPEMDFSDGTPTIGSSTFLPSLEKQNSYVLTENLTWIRGRHALKFGAEIRREQFTIFQPAASRGQISFGNDFTDNPGLPTTGGKAFATFLLGIPDGGEITSLHNVDYHRPIYAVYGQDDLKVSSRLTLNLGLRYEIFTTVKEGRDEEGTFDFASQSIIVPKGQTMQLTPTLGASIPVRAIGSRGLISPDLNNFAPRVGLAYKITDKLVLRSGYGIFYGGQEPGPYSNPSPGFNPPFFSIQSFNQPCFVLSANPGTDCSIPNFNRLQNGFPANSLSDPNTPLLYSIDPKLRTPYNQQWHFGFQYQLPASTLLDISYGASRGLHLFGFYNGNEAVPTADQTAPTGPRRPVNTCNTTLLPNCDPSVFDTTIFTFRSNAVSNYHSLQMRLEKRFTHGLQFSAAYTYSHALDDASSASLGSQASGDFRDQTNPLLEYGNSDFDIRQRFVFSYFYELPFGKGKAFGGNASGALNQIIANWQVAGIITASTGNYLSAIDSSTNIANSDGGGVVATVTRPNRVGDPNGKPCAAGALFNTCAFATNTVLGTFGNAGRNIIRAPGFQNWDFSVFKSFPVNEKYRFEFRGEFFNIWNHTNLLFAPASDLFSTPATDLGLPTFGFAAAARDPRFIQLALKFYF